MPYISSQSRKSSENNIFDNPGDLNYAIHQMLDKYISQNGLRYRTINDIIGCLECIKHELYRRLAVPYEEEKMHENGDCKPYHG